MFLQGDQDDTLVLLVLLVLQISVQVVVAAAPLQQIIVPLHQMEMTLQDLALVEVKVVIRKQKMAKIIGLFQAVMVAMVLPVS